MRISKSTPWKNRGIIFYYLNNTHKRVVDEIQGHDKKSGNWWIGWLVDLPRVTAQEKTREELLRSLKIGAEDLLNTAVPLEAEAEMTTSEIPTPEWILENGVERK